MKIIRHIFTVLLCLTLLCTSLPVSALETYEPDTMISAYSVSAIDRVESIFDDLHPNGWYLSGIQYCYGAGIMQGTGNNLFEPNGHVTREQVAMILYNYLKADETYTSYSFDDVAPGAWYADAVEWMYRNGYTKGINRYKYGVGRYVTRQDMITLIYNVIFREYHVPMSIGAENITARAVSSPFPTRERSRITLMKPCALP